MTRPFKLCLDPGHGMSNKITGRYDPGACSHGVSEAEVALQYALTLVAFLKAEKIPYFLTRDDATDHAPISTRDDRAELAGCTHFLSLHLNALNGQARGIETFYRDAGDLPWARAVQRAAVSALGLPVRATRKNPDGVKHESETYVGKLAVMGFDGPAALLELGFVDNALDRAELVKRDRRIGLATALMPVIRTEKRRLEDA